MFFKALGRCVTCASGLCAVLVTLWIVFCICCRASSIPHCYTRMLSVVVLSLLNCSCSVGRPGEAVRDEGPTEFKIMDPPTTESPLMASLLCSKFHDDFFFLLSIRTRFCPEHHVTSCWTSALLADPSPSDMISATSAVS